MAALQRCRVLNSNVASWTRTETSTLRLLSTRLRLIGLRNDGVVSASVSRVGKVGRFLNSDAEFTQRTFKILHREDEFHVLAAFLGGGSGGESHSGAGDRLVCNVCDELLRGQGDQTTDSKVVGLKPGAV